jgi:hypothetical protein
MGVSWMGDGNVRTPQSSVFLTRLHVRYDRDHFPEDLAFQETANRENFQGRYVLRHPFTGEASCATGQEYRRTLGRRGEEEAQNLATLTGWDIGAIRRKMGTPQKVSDAAPISLWDSLLGR